MFATYAGLECFTGRWSRLPTRLAGSGRRYCLDQAQGETQRGGRRDSFCLSS